MGGEMNITASVMNIRNVNTIYDMGSAGKTEK